MTDYISVKELKNSRIDFASCNYKKAKRIKSSHSMGEYSIDPKLSFVQEHESLLSIG